MTHDPSKSVSQLGPVYQIEAQIKQLQAKLYLAIEGTWPVGSSVRWIKTGRHPVFGTVLRIAADRLLVCNADTGREVRITPYHIACAGSYDARNAR